MTSLRWCAAALFALAGCSDSDPLDPPPDPDGVRAITARDALTFRAADGSTRARPVDLDPAVIQAYARDPGGAWRVFAGEGTSDGTLTVAGVPAGGAWLRIDYFDAAPEARVRNEYFWVDGDADVALDLGTWRFGRADVSFATTVPTEVQLDLAGLAPWQPGLDLAIVYAPNADFVQAFSEDRDGISGMPRADATGSSLRVDWASALGAPLLDQARGDRLWAWQFRFREVAGMYVGAPVRSGLLPAFTQRDGAATTVPAALSAPQQIQARVAMDRDAFDALRPAIGRDVGPSFGRGFAISSSPSTVTEEFSPLSLAAELVVVEGEAITATGLFDLGDVDIALPFDVDTVYGSFISAYPVTVARDDGITAIAQAEIGVMTHTLPTASAPAAPIIGPVRGVTVGGRDAFTSPQGVGLAPEIRWDAPALGTPVEYEVRILAPGGADPRYDFVWYPSAVFHVPGDQTSLALPPEVLEPGLPYALAIRAITHGLAADVRATAPRHLALPYGWADTITPQFKP